MVCLQRAPILVAALPNCLSKHEGGLISEHSIRNKRTEKFADEEHADKLSKTTHGNTYLQPTKTTETPVDI